MINIKPINYKEYEGWLNSLDLISSSTEWLDFVIKHYRGSPNFLGIFEDNKLKFIIPAFVMEKKLEGVTKLYTEPIVHDNSDQKKIAIGSILKDLPIFDSLQFSFAFILDRQLQNLFFGEGKTVVRGLAHVLYPVSQNPDEVLAKQVEHKTRNQIKAAYQRGNFQLEIRNNLDDFFELYLNSIKRLRSLPKPKEFFVDLKACFGDNFKIISAYQDGQLAGANLVLLKNNYLHLPFNVSDNHYFNDYVNNFLYWETIKFGLGRGIKIFDFGPSNLSDRTHQHFKEGFGAVPIPIFRISQYNSLSARLEDWTATHLRNLALRLKKLT